MGELCCHSCVGLLLLLRKQGGKFLTWPNECMIHSSDIAFYTSWSGCPKGLVGKNIYSITIWRRLNFFLGFPYPVRGTTPAVGCPSWSSFLLWWCPWQFACDIGASTEVFLCIFLTFVFCFLPFLPRRVAATRSSTASCFETWWRLEQRYRRFRRIQRLRRRSGMGDDNAKSACRYVR